MTSKTLVYVLFALILTGCVDRGQADEKLAKGCTAAAGLFLSEGQTIKGIKDSIFGESSDLGAGYRVVTLKAVETDGWTDTENEYRCIFEEDFGFLKASYTATIYQLQVNDQTYGKKDGEILGTFEDHLKLEQAVEKAMR